ncbi:MAG: TrkA family potassium uptake protein [Phycisphaeraceae bacterium]|nr:TrkA family potassium uptake protein [Phycisphaeraceae bacterium]
MSVYQFHTDHERQEMVGALLRRFGRAMVFLVVTVVVGAVGFAVLADRGDPIGERALDGLWDTLNVVSTVGALPEFTDAQRIWAMCVIVFGLGAVLYGFGSMQALLHGGEINQWMERRKMEKTLESTRGHLVLCGYGEVGRAVGRTARAIEPRISVVVVDRDERAASRAEADGFLVILGDCAEEGVLARAGAERARGVIATLDRDEANVYLCLTVREMNRHARIVTRASRDEVRGVLRRAGADRVIVPGELAALQLSHLMLRPKATEFVAAAIGGGEYEFVEVPAKEHPGLVGKSLRELNFPNAADALVVSIVSEGGQQVFNPSADREVGGGDTLVVVCKVGGLARIEAMGRG